MAIKALQFFKRFFTYWTLVAIFHGIEKKSSFQTFSLQTVSGKSFVDILIVRLREFVVIFPFRQFLYVLREHVGPTMKSWHWHLKDNVELTSFKIEVQAKVVHLLLLHHRVVCARKVKVFSLCMIVIVFLKLRYEVTFYIKILVKNPSNDS